MSPTGELLRLDTNILIRLVRGDSLGERIARDFGLRTGLHKPKAMKTPD